MSDAVATGLDIAAIRRDTPGCEHVLHLDSAGSALPPRQVVRAVVDHLELESRVGGYEAQARARTAIEGAYASIAALLNCGPDEIAHVENATRAWDMAFYAFARRLGPGDRILTSVSEYSSNRIACLQVAQRAGAVVEVVPNDEHGALSVPALRAMIDDRVRLIAITHVPTNGGLVNPAAEVGAVAREAGVPFLLDACQSVGQMPIDVERIGCDALSATGRKFLRGPRGTGFLYVRRRWIEALEPPFLDLHAATLSDTDRYVVRGDARRFENWESFVAGRVGLGVAVDYALGLGLERIGDRIRALAAGLREALARIPGIRVLDLGRPQARCGIVTFDHRSVDAASLQRALRAEAINVSTSGRTSTLVDMSRRGLDSIVRASVHCHTTEDELATFCRAVARITGSR